MTPESRDNPFSSEFDFTNFWLREDVRGIEVTTIKRKDGHVLVCQKVWGFSDYRGKEGRFGFNMALTKVLKG
jgi:hypothetical protein